MFSLSELLIYFTLIHFILKMKAAALFFIACRPQKEKNIAELCMD